MSFQAACERCAAPLPEDSREARVCAHGCTFCRSCASHALAHRCPNCGGELLARPRLNLRDARVAHLDAAIGGIPDGADSPRFVELLRHGTMTVELYAPRGHDPQEPHAQDELYVVATGTAALRIGEIIEPLTAGSVAFVRAGEDHRFEEFSDDFSTWVVFWGPEGGEQ